MSFWSSLWGAPDLVNKATDAAISTGDKLFFTEEERAEFKAKFADWYLRYLEVSKGSDLARRLIAVMFTTLVVVQVLVAIVFYIIGAATGSVVMQGGTPTLAQNVWMLAADKQIGLLTSVTLPIELTIVAFYFTVRAVTNFVNKRDES